MIYKIQAMLQVCFYMQKHNSEITPDLETSICGNRIYVKTLDLYTDFKNIASQLDEIISYIKIH